MRESPGTPDTLQPSQRSFVLPLIGLLVLFGGLALYPFLAPNLFYIKIVNEMMIFGLLAMSLDVLLGYTGLLSFMHNAYLGIGAYLVGIFLIHVAPASLWFTLLVGITGSCLVALPVGWVQVRTGGLAFALLTIAFGMMFYTLVWKLDITGGSDGLMGVPFPDITIGGLYLGNTGDPTTMYLFTLIIVTLAFFATRRIIHSPFGAVLQCIRENEERASFIGYNVRKYKLLGWLLACMLAGLSGGLFILFKGYIGPPTMSIFAGAGVLMMVLLGGIRSLWGPIVGACIFIYIEDYISTMTEYWEFLVGLIVVGLVLFMPNGVAGVRKRFRQSP